MEFINVFDFVSDIKNYFRDIFTGMKNLYIWFPIIWKDRNFDQFYLYKILEFKIRNMGDEFLSERVRNFIDVEKEGNEMIKCADTLRKVMEDNYTQEYFADIDRIYGEAHFITVNGGSAMKLVRDNVKTREEEKLVDKLVLEADNKAEEAKMKDLSFVMDSIKNNSLKWWW